MSLVTSGVGAMTDIETLVTDADDCCAGVCAGAVAVMCDVR